MDMVKSPLADLSLGCISQLIISMFCGYTTHVSIYEAVNGTSCFFTMSKKFPMCKINAPMGVQKEPTDPFHTSIRPLRITASLFGVWPVRFHKDKYVFSFLLFGYGCVLTFFSSVYRIYLEPQAAPGFIYQIMRLKNLLVPVSFFVSGLVLIVKAKKFVSCLNALWSYRRFMTLAQFKFIFYMQIVLILAGFASHIVILAILLASRPIFFSSDRAIKCYILDLHMLLGLYFVKLEFFLIMNLLRNVLIVIRKKITALEKPATSSFSATSGDVTYLIDLYDGIVNQAEDLNDCFGVGLGVVTLLTVINCFTTGYFYFAIKETDIDWFLIIWLLTDLWQIWLILTGTELFMKDVSGFTIFKKCSMIFIAGSVVNDCRQ